MSPLLPVAAALVVNILFVVAIDQIRRQRREAVHAQTWAIAFGLLAAGWLAVLSIVGLRGDAGGPHAATSLCWLAASLTFVHGLRQRAHRADRVKLLIGVWAATAFGLALLLDMAPDAAGLAAIVPSLQAGGLLLGVAAVWPFGGRWHLTDAVATGVLAVSALFQVAMGWLTLNTGAAPVVPMGDVALLAIPVYVALGLVAMLLLGRDQAAALHRLARVDALTNVWNRRGFEEAAAFLIARLPRAAQATVAIADIDAFKSINDRHGHAVGDAALVRFAEMLGAAVERGDVLARLGGEEFALLALNADGQALFDRVERVRQTLALPGGGTSPPMTASFGVAELGTNKRSLRDALERADKALYRAKHEGRNRSILGEPPAA